MGQMYRPRPSLCPGARRGVQGQSLLQDPRAPLPQPASIAPVQLGSAGTPGPVCFISFNTVCKAKAGEGRRGRGEEMKGRVTKFFLPNLRLILRIRWHLEGLMGKETLINS